MPFDDQTPTDGPPSTGEPAVSRRRRTPRAWSSPVTPIERERADRPVPETRWGSSPPPPPAPAEAVGPPAAPGIDPQVAAELRKEVRDLAELIKGSAGITGPELATTIENLGTTLGTGMAGLLSDHRALLARDVEAAADRILEDLGQRLRGAVTQTVDGVDERLRQVSARGFAALGEELELRIDQLQSDVTGLRAVMLEIPDQTAVLAKLDVLGDQANARRDRLSPAMSAALERSIAGPLERLETAVGAVAEMVEELEGEVTALRRRLTLRSELKPPTEDDRVAAAEHEAPADEADVEDVEEVEVEEQPEEAPAPARRVRRTVAGARVAKAAAAKKAAKAAPPAPSSKKAGTKPAPGRRRSSS